MESADRMWQAWCEALPPAPEQELPEQKQHEQTAPDRFSLATLQVHADTASNSETGYEED